MFCCSQLTPIPTRYRLFETTLKYAARFFLARCPLTHIKVEALSALKRLQELLQEGAVPFAKRVMTEISNPDIVVAQGSAQGEALASTPLLRKIQEGAELIRVEVLHFFCFVGPFLLRSAVVVVILLGSPRPRRREGVFNYP